ncbi:hypothetical protein BURKHO8Y_10124 [Burkholderia sp. 8Y]|nr:hypothetical protein BURKHO8Y_10124 [Burkholderia sp. 8Y]
MRALLDAILSKPSVIEDSVDIHAGRTLASGDLSSPSKPVEEKVWQVLIGKIRSWISSRRRASRPADAQARQRARPAPCSPMS